MKHIIENINLLDCQETVLQQFLDFLMFNLDITNDCVISFEEYLGENLNGLCIHHNDMYEVYVMPLGRSITEVFITLAHEFVHVHQFIYKNLHNEIKMKNEIAYKDRWWEIEADEVSIKLVKDFVCLLQK